MPRAKPDLSRLVMLSYTPTEAVILGSLLLTMRERALNLSQDDKVVLNDSLAMARTTAQGALPGVKRFKLHAPVIRESVLHKQIADVLRLELCAPGHVSRDGVTWWSVDMAAYVGNAPGIRTGRGCIAGVPDIMVLHQGGAYFIEIKADDGTLSPAQRELAFTIINVGAFVGIARNASETLALLDAWDIPRAHRIRGS